MYLAPTPQRRTLGNFRMRPGLDGSQWSRTAQRRRTWSMNGLRGDAEPIDWQNIYSIQPDPAAVVTLTYPPTPASVGAQAASTMTNVPQVLQNIYTAAQLDYNPLDYVSPQAAIAAGLDSQVVYDAWAIGLAKYPTQQAAVAAGIPATVVTQLWASSRQYAAGGGTSSSWLDQAPLGIANKWLLAAGGGIFAIAAMAKGRH